ASSQSWREEQYSSSSSSSQFFMKRPTTSWPCCFSSHAAIDESTPPDMPTTTLTPDMPLSKSRDRRHRGRVRVQQIERIALPAQVIVDAAPHQRAAPLGGVQRQLLPGQPQRAHDAAVQGPPRDRVTHLSGEGETQEGGRV